MISLEVSARAANKQLLSSGLVEHLETAEKIQTYINSQIEIIVNYPERNSKKLNTDSLNLLEMAFEIAYTPVCDLIEDLLDEKSTDKAKKDALAKIAKAAKESKLGTCLEMSALGYTYSHELLSKPVEIFHIKNGNHVFLVLGRDLDSHPTDYKRWGETAVICDVWKGESYLASKLEKQLKNFGGQTLGATTMLKPFNPQKQYLKRLV